MRKTNKKLALHQLSQIGKALIMPFFLGRNKIPFKPTFVSLEVEDSCNLKCLHCDIWKKGRNPRRLSLEQMKKAVVKLKDWLGTFHLNLTGGEPFLGKDTIPLIKFASREGISVHTNSNGFLIDKGLARRIVESGLDSLSISLDSLKPEVHNRLRGNKKAFKQAIKALELVTKLRRQKPFLSIVTVVMKQNLDELENLVYWTKKKGLDSIFFQALWQNFDAEYDPAWFSLSDFWPRDSKKVKKVMDRLTQLKKGGYPIGNNPEDFARYRKYFTDPTSFGKGSPCFVGVNNFAIDTAGNARLCFNFPPVGNILKEDLEAIWNGKKACAQRLKIARCKRGCKVLLCNTPMSRGQALSLLVDKIKKVPRKLTR